MLRSPAGRMGLWRWLSPSTKPTASVRSFTRLAWNAPVRTARSPLVVRRNLSTSTPRQYQQPQYNRFSRAQTVGLLWRRSPIFRGTLYISGGGLVFFVYRNIEEVPGSGRYRFNCVSPEYEEQMGTSQYKEILQQFRGRIMPSSSRETMMVRRVLDRLIPHSGIDQDKEWTVHVIDANEANAFVIPGGKVFVFRGILPICGDEDGLAAVLGHEIAHNVAHHAAENMSRVAFLLPLAYLASAFLDVSGNLAMWVLDLALNKPGSRRQETEADYLGLMMMAESCYDPSKAVGLWERMEKAESVRIPQFLSTHPSNHNRIEKIREWLPQARNKYDEGDCGYQSYLMQGFRKTSRGRDELVW